MSDGAITGFKINNDLTSDFIIHELGLYANNTNEIIIPLTGCHSISNWQEGDYDPVNRLSLEIQLTLAYQILTFFLLIGYPVPTG
jgi:hypothetical protein